MIEAEDCMSLSQQIGSNERCFAESAMTTCDDYFAYESLDSTKYSTRIIRLEESVSEDDEIRCTLEHFDVETGKPYVCLSYCWGEAQPTHIIYVNGQRFDIRHNLWNCLRRLRRQKVKDRLWVDAICIDQGNIAERGHQVRFMGDIYRMANHVLMYMGDSSWEKKLLKVAQPVEAIRYESHSKDKDRGYNPDRRERRWILPESFLQEPYWSRMWILQEVLLARVVYIVLSEVKLDLRRVTPLTNASTPGGVVMSLREKQGSSRPFTPYDLDELLMRTSNFKCQEPSDQVYALLGLVRDDITGRFPIDYTRSRPEVVFDVLQHMQIDCKIPKRLSKSEARLYTLPQLTVNRVMDVFAILSCKASVLCRECAISPEHFTDLSDIGKMLRGEEQKFEFAWIPEDVDISSSCSRQHLSSDASYCTNWKEETRYLFCQCCVLDLLDGRDNDRLKVSRKCANIMLGRIKREPPPSSIHYVARVLRRRRRSNSSTDLDSSDEDHDLDVKSGIGAS